MFRHQYLRLGRVHFYLLAQPVYVGLQGMRHQRGRMIPDIGIERLATHHRIARAVKLLQDCVLFFAEIDVFFAVIALQDLDRRAEKVGPNTKGRVLAHFVLADMGAQARQQNPEPERLGNVIVGAGIQAQHRVGIAVETERGLLVPVIRDAGELNIAGLAKRISDVADRTRTNKVSPDELSGGTFTVTNTGSRGALFDTPIINQPQVAILGTGAVVKRPIVVTDATGQDVIAIRSMVYLALSYDHRLVDGADAARFLGTMKDRLEGAAFEAEIGL